MAAYSPQPDQSNNGTRDLFLSYNSRDREAVVCIKQSLQACGLTTFFDRDNLTPGRIGFDELDIALSKVQAVAIFIGEYGLGPWQKREMWIALDRAAQAEKASSVFPVIPVLLPKVRLDEAPGFLLLHNWVDLRGGIDDQAAFGAIARAVKQDAPASLLAAMVAPPVALCPYRGLLHFREEDAPLFFGREELAQQLLEKVKQHPLVAVVGPSGSGKSSVVQAGLLPLLRRERRPSWEALIFTPGQSPFDNLARQLVPLWEMEMSEVDRLTEIGKLKKGFHSGDISLADAFALTIKHARGAERLVVIVDQFEELFTLTGERDRKPFVESLLAAIVTEPVTVVLSLRADFYNQAMQLNLNCFPNAQVNVNSMTQEQLRFAIEKPAHSVGLHFEAGLVDRMLDHVKAQPGNLPLLEFALTELWERRLGNQLSNQQYNNIGEVEGAISRRAEEQFNQLSSTEQELALRIFTRLVHVAAAGEEGTDTRQRVRLKDLDAAAHLVVRAFVKERLLVMNRDEETDEEVVEVAHEALIRRWGRLKELLSKDKQFLLWRQRLGLDIKEWQHTNRDAGVLLRGARLNEAKRWHKERGQDLNNSEREFIENSKSAARRPRQWAMAVVALGIVVALIVLGWKLWNDRPESQINKILSESNNLIKATATNRENSNTINTIKEWIRTLVLVGKSKEALEAILKIEDSDLRPSVLISIVETLAQVGNIGEALKVAGNIREIERPEAMVKIAEAFAKEGKINEALEIAKTNVQIHSDVIVKVAKILARAGKNDEALDTIRKIEDLHSRSGALLSFEKELARSGKDDKTRKIVNEMLEVAWLERLEAARKIISASSRSSELSSVAIELAEAGRNGKARQVANESLAWALRTEDTSFRSWGLHRVIDALIKAGENDKALEVAQKIKDSTDQSTIMDKIAVAFTEAGKNDKALEVARMIKNENSRSMVMDKVAIALARMGKSDEAFEISLAIENTRVPPGMRETGNVYIQSHMHDGARLRVAKALANAGWNDKALEMAQKIENAHSRSEAIVEIAGSLAKSGKNDEGYKVIRLIENIEGIPQKLVSVVEIFSKAGKIDEALEVTRKINDAYFRTSALRVVTIAATKMGKTDKTGRVANESIELARKIENAYLRSKALANIGESLAEGHEEDAARDVIEEAQRAAGQVIKDEERSQAFAKVAEGLAKLHYYRLARETASLCTSSGDKLIAYAAILREYHIQRNPSLAKLFEEEK